MRILWYGPHPDMPTGYATQTALILPRLQALGHEVAVSATAGQDNRPGQWRGIPIFPCTTYAEVGQDTVGPNYADWNADIVFTFLCTWLLEKYPRVWHQMRTVHITPVDCTPMGVADAAVIEATHGMPAAISSFGRAQMTARGFDPLFLPHGVDTKTFAPASDGDELRGEMGYDGQFVVGMNFMNNDPERKNIDPAFGAFAKFHAEHPDSVLAVHAIEAMPEGYVLPKLAAHLGILPALRLSPQAHLVRGMITPAMLAPWYQACDVVLDVGNEGFGLTGLEAQACGTPVIRGEWSTGPELVGPGWLTGHGHRYYNRKHEAAWYRADEDDLAGQLEDAYQDAAKRRDDARDFALSWDINRIMREHWEPVLADLEG